jgi:hypothetical protein
VVVGARVDDPQRPTGWQRHGVAGAARAHWSNALHDYGAIFLVVSLSMEPVGCEELTMGVFNRWGAPEQDARQQGSSFNLRQRWGETPRDDSQQGWAKRVRRRMYNTGVGLMELEKCHTRRGDEKGEPKVCFGFLRNPDSKTIYL